MNADSIKLAISSNTKQFLTNYLREDQLKLLLSKDLPRQFLNNFFDLPQIRKTFMYLPMTKLRAMTKSDDSMDDIAVVNKINDAFYDYSEQLLDIIIGLNEDDRRQFIVMMPHDVLVDVIVSNNDNVLKYMQGELLALDDLTLMSYQQNQQVVKQEEVTVIQEGFFFSDLPERWFGVR